MSDLEMHFSEEIYHIDSAVKKSGFPVVIKSENDISTGRKGSHDYYEDGLKLPYRSVTMLERRITLQFAHVTVMEFRDPDKVLSERGIEFVESHSEYEDDDYLLPLMYPGKCKIVHPPGKRKRYVAVSELMNDLPHLIKVNDQLVSVDPGSDEGESVQVIFAGEILEIVGVKTVKETRFLSCKDKTSKELMISENVPVNVTAVDDTNQYTLKELTDKILLPKCVEFEDVTPYDIVIFDDLWANHLLVMAAGPFRVNSVVELEVIVGWCIPVSPKGEISSVRTVLIPKKKWGKQKVKIRSFSGLTERIQYTKKHFPRQNDSEYVNYKLYVMETEPISYPSILWLQDRNPMPYDTKRDSRGQQKTFRPPPLTVDKEELPHSDVGEDYEIPEAALEPAPPIPPRSVKLPTRIEKNELWKGVLEKIQLKARSGFDKVHWEIHNLFRNKTEGKPPKLYPRPTERPIQKYRHKSDGVPAKPAVKPKLKRNQSEHIYKQKPADRLKKKSSSVSDVSVHSEKNEANMLQAEEETKDTESLSDGEDYLTPSDTTIQCETDSVFESLIEDNQDHRIPNRPQMPLPDPPLTAEQTDESEELKHEYDYPEFRDLLKCEKDKKKGYVGIDVDEADRVSRQGQTADDFYDYTVEEVVQCFKQVALSNIAEICERERFDGKFFQHLSEEEIKTYFDLKQLHLIKVRRTINGWRPR